MRNSNSLTRTRRQLFQRSASLVFEDGRQAPRELQSCGCLKPDRTGPHRPQEESTSKSGAASNEKDPRSRPSDCEGSEGDLKDSYRIRLVSTSFVFLGVRPFAPSSNALVPSSLLFLFKSQGTGAFHQSVWFFTPLASFLIDQVTSHFSCLWRVFECPSQGNQSF